MDNLISSNSVIHSPTVPSDNADLISTEIITAVRMDEIGPPWPLLSLDNIAKRTDPFKPQARLSRMFSEHLYTAWLFRSAAHLQFTGLLNISL
jgi:hypothetical protein